MILRPFLPSDESNALAAHDELAPDGFEFLLDRDRATTWADYLALVARSSTDPAPDRVPSALLAAVVDGELVGRVSIRFALNEWLATYGGHIGYGVRPAFRRRGHATAILRAALAVAADHGIESALLTCDDTNVGSATVIERCGGVLENVVVDPDGGVPKRRYHVPTVTG